MNKKIKIIELWNIIAQVENIEKLPKKIKYNEKIYELQTLSRDYYYKRDDDYLTDRVNDKPFNIFLNDEVEILEDNTEEIKELPINAEDEKLYSPVILDNRIKINELVRAYNKSRKEKTND